MTLLIHAIYHYSSTKHTQHTTTHPTHDATPMEHRHNTQHTLNKLAPPLPLPTQHSTLNTALVAHYATANIWFEMHQIKNSETEFHKGK